MSVSRTIRVVASQTDWMIALAILAAGAIAIILAGSILGGPFLVLGLSLFGSRRARSIARNRRLGSLRASAGLWNRPAIAAASWVKDSPSLVPATTESFAVSRAA